MMRVSPEVFRHAMRQWTTGVAVVTSRFGDTQHGMTVNSFTSLSLDPPLVSITLANDTRTRNLVQQAGVFGVTILAEEQGDLSDRFAGRIPDEDNRFEGIDTYTLISQSPLLASGLVCLDCIVVHSYFMSGSTLYIGQVQAVKHNQQGKPLVYHNRIYRRLWDG
ncbi:MAG: flavin reductase family protein [Chloroflexota bacterium]|jgi:flavin reductase (DIM6/NTAB) family NADH-FMN oxidoreductase RutF